MDLRILRYDIIDSTNSEALRQAKQGAPEGLCIVAAEQTAGRGRLDRKWVSKKGSGLYFSMVLRPRLDPSLVTLVTLMSAVSVHDALLRTAVDADIKWVNDLLVGGRKICGILAETADTPTGPAVVVGIGINLNLKSSGFPPELAETATSIEAESGIAPNADRVIEDLCDAMVANYETLSGPDGPETIRRLWSERSSYAEGKEVRVRIGAEEFEGVTRGIEANGALRVETADGLRVVQAGEISLLRQL